MRVTVLGCGSSKGVPLIGNNWGHCDPANPRNRRTRASILVESDQGTTVLVDTSPDVREQLLRTGVSRLDAILYTHLHADHTHGIDDIQPLSWLQKAPIPAYANRETLDDLLSRFPYCFLRMPQGQAFSTPFLSAQEIGYETLKINDLEVEAFEQDHHYCISLGFRFGRFAYSTDVVRLNDRAFKVLDGVDTWIVDCTREEPVAVHAHLELTLEWIERLKPRRTYLTHMNHTLDYETLRRKLPTGVEPAYDGLIIEVPA